MVSAVSVALLLFAQLNAKSLYEHVFRSFLIFVVVLFLGRTPGIKGNNRASAYIKGGDAVDDPL